MLTATVVERTLTLMGELQVHHLQELKADLSQVLEETDFFRVDCLGGQ